MTPPPPGTLPQDRVESSPAQVAECTALAEALTSQTGIPTRVVGWYHSHPHITVLPSHVDVQTQVSGGTEKGRGAGVAALLRPCSAQHLGLSPQLRATAVWCYPAPQLCTLRCDVP